MLQDPSTELLALVRRAGDAPSAADRDAAALVRRRFAMALPPPFATPIDPATAPVRIAVPIDGPAIAAVKWRTFGASYRDVLPDAFLDQRDVVPPASFWIGRAAVPPSRRHALVVLGRPGEVHGYCDAGPCRDDGMDPMATGEVYELYVDPTAQRGGGGRRLLDETVDRLTASGAADVRLWVIAGNRAGRAFYESSGWEPDGATRREDLGVVVLDELRYRRTGRTGRS